MNHRAESVSPAPIEHEGDLSKSVAIDPAQLVWSEAELANISLRPPLGFCGDKWWEDPTPKQRAEIDKRKAEFSRVARTMIPLFSPAALLERGAITLEEAADPKIRQYLYENIEGGGAKAHAEFTADTAVAASIIDAEIQLMREFDIPLNADFNPFKVNWGSFVSASYGSLETADLYLTFAKRLHTLQQEHKPQQTSKACWLECLNIISNINGLALADRPRVMNLDEQAFVMGNILDSRLAVWGLDESNYPRTVRSILGEHGYNGKSGARRSIVLTRSTHLIKTLIEKEGVDDWNADNTFTICNRYGNRHGLSQQRAEAFLQNVYPLIRDQDPRLHQGNTWGMSYGEFGLSDFMVHCFTSKWDTQNIRDLMMALQEFPTTEYSRMRQNRKDGYSLIGIGLRDFVHDQRPGVHELVSAAVDFYDTSKIEGFDPIVLATKKDLLEELVARAGADGYAHGQDALLDPTLYEKASRNVSMNEDEDEESIIEVLRRLEVNTRPIDNEPPQTLAPELNESLRTYYEHPTTRNLYRLTVSATRLISENIANKTVGIDPDFIKAFFWIDQKQAGYLRSLEQMSQAQIMHDPTFQSILEFISVTSDPEHSKQEIDQLLSGLNNDGLPLVERKQLYLRYVLMTVNKVARQYSAQGKGRWTDGLWSGNNIDGMIMLAQNA